MSSFLELSSRSVALLLSYAEHTDLALMLVFLSVPTPHSVVGFLLRFPSESKDANGFRRGGDLRFPLCCCASVLATLVWRRDKRFVLQLSGWKRVTPFSVRPTLWFS